MTTEGAKMTNEWEPIRTAPRDGTQIEVAWIVNYPNIEKIEITRWIGDSKKGKWEGDWTDRKSTRLNSSHSDRSRMPSSA